MTYRDKLGAWHSMHEVLAGQDPGEHTDSLDESLLGSSTRAICAWDSSHHLLTCDDTPQGIEDTPQGIGGSGEKSVENGL